jgi:hypothetical protein
MLTTSRIITTCVKNRNGGCQLREYWAYVAMRPRSLQERRAKAQASYRFIIKLNSRKSLFNYVFGAHSKVDGRDTILQSGRSRVRIPMR